VPSEIDVNEPVIVPLPLNVKTPIMADSGLAILAVQRLVKKL
jgi:hypothetical protein